MFEIWLPVGFAVFIWWFSTGLILLLDRLPYTSFRWSLLLSTALAAAALLGLAHTAPQDSVTGAFCAFTSALIVWGWHELSFLTGWITGPRRHALPAGTVGWPRFVQSLRAILWHEIGLLAMGVAIVALTWQAANQVGTWTFLVLWVMRTSAKLNLFFGVRNLSEEFLPAHLKYLQSFFRRRPMNGFFPVAVTASTVLAVVLVQGALADGVTAGERAGLMLVASLLVLGIVEHWMLVLPLQTSALWRWALRSRGADAAAINEQEEALLHAH